MTTYAVGDIQGCYDALRKLLKKVGFRPSVDQLWCLGDLVNRGPKSGDTLRYLQDLGDSCKIILGNHDLHFIALHEGCAPGGNKDTLEALLAAADCAQLCDWLRGQPLAYLETIETLGGPRDHLMVHAGICPKWSLKKTLKLAAEVESALRAESYRDFLSNMYGNLPDRWSNRLTGFERLRVITNYLTRLRFCNDSGALDLTSKSGVSTAPEGFAPWFFFETLSAETTLLFGHWAALEGITGRKHVHALDTGYVWGRELTLMRLEDGRRFEIAAEATS